MLKVIRLKPDVLGGRDDGKWMFSLVDIGVLHTF
jgi:hypothetical protein